MKLSRFLVYLTVLLIPLYYWRFELVGIPTNFVEILIAIGVALTIWLKVTGQLKDRARLPLQWPIILLLLGVGIGVLVSDDKQAALGILKGWFVVPILFFWWLSALRDELNWSVLGWLMIANTIGVSTYALLQYGGVIGLIAHQNIGGDLGQYIDQKRALAFFESPNYLAMYLVPLTILAFGYLKSRGVWLLTLSLPVAAVVLSGSRSGIFALVIGGLLVWLLGKSRSRAFVWSAVGLSIIAVVVMAVLMQNDASSGALRQYIWQQSLMFGADHPLTGIGPGQFQDYFIQNADQTSSAYSFVLPYALHPHNIFLGFWLSAGLAGLAGFVWLVTMLIRAAGKKLGDPLTLGAFGALIAILAHGLFDTTYFKNDLSLIFFLVATIIVVRADHHEPADD